MSLHVIVQDNETGMVEEHLVRDNDYLLLLDGTCEVASAVAHRNGTHQLVIKGRR